MNEGYAILNKKDPKNEDYVFVVPDMKYYRPAQSHDRFSQKEDIFNIGKFRGMKDEYILSINTAGKTISPWKNFYLVRKDRKN